MPSKLRVVITGAGLLSSLGHDLEQTVVRLSAGSSGVVEVPEWKDLGVRSWVSGRADAEPLRAKTELKKRALDTMGEVACFACLATEQALRQSGLTAQQIAAADFGCLVGSGVSSMMTIYRGATQIFSGQPRRVRPYSVLQSMSSACSAHIVQNFGVGGRSYSISSACATSTHSIGTAFELIRAGLLGGAIAGGAEETNSIVAGAFNALRSALSGSFNDTPERASRPFDCSRDGFVLSEGAGVLVLEELGRAQARGATILGEILGFAANSESYDLVMPDPSGAGAAECMRAAIADAELEPSDIDVINAHATSTPAGDLAEGRAIRSVFEQPPHITAPKSMTGHSLAAVGAQEIIYSLLMIEAGFIAPTINLDQCEPELEDLPVVTELQAAETRVHLSNSFGFGGTNGTLIVARFEA